MRCRAVRPRASLHGCDPTAPHPEPRFRVALRSGTDAANEPSPIRSAQGRAMGRSARRHRPARHSTPPSLTSPWGDSMPDILVLVIAGIMWFNVLFIGFRMWVARKVRTDQRHAARSFGGGRRRSPH